VKLGLSITRDIRSILRDCRTGSRLFKFILYTRSFDSRMLCVIIY
jgi:hypothetical protein